MHFEINKKKGGLLMAKPLERTVIVTDRQFGDDHPLDVAIQILLESLEKLKTCQEAFHSMIGLELPTKADTQHFWKKMYEIDPDFDFIENLDDFKESVRRYSSFTEFCLHQNNQFKLSLLNYLGNGGIAFIKNKEDSLK